MKDEKQLRNDILKLDGRGYPAYKSLKGSWKFKHFILNIDHVQSDPFAGPSDVSVFIEDPGYPKHLYENKDVRVALQDVLIRMFGEEIKKVHQDRKGSGKSGVLRISSPGQEVLERSACRIDPKTGSVLLRFNVGFPARGRTILAKELVRILIDLLPELVKKALLYKHFTKRQKEVLQDVYELTQDQVEIRKQLKEKNLAAFIADGAILPRRSGASDKPMGDAIPFQSTEEGRIELNLPYHGKITGLGIPNGITLIIGGGYHGKSTLLKALEKGVYNHVRGDGREYVITAEDAVKIRAEDGRAVQQEDISSFIQNLPNGKDTKTFTTEDASGSTSQAANVVEALEAGSKLLLVDEDTSATNFMVRDGLMSQVVDAEIEPIIPFTSRIEDLSDAGISTILVAGSSGSYFDKADLILQMNAYKPVDVTKKAKKIAHAHPQEETAYAPFTIPQSRIPMKNPLFDQDRIKVKTASTDTVNIAREDIDVRYLEQLTDPEQLSAIGKMLVYAQKHIFDNEKDVNEIADLLYERLDKEGIEIFGKGNLARPRKAELLGSLNRMRSQKFSQK